MTDTTIARSEEPDGAPRIASLDILRGIAILGILFMNIPAMGAPLAAAHSPLPDVIGWTPLDQGAWWVQQLFLTGTARGLLELLFGAGMVILTARVAEGRTGWSAARRYYWRMIVLLAFGLIHVWILLWPGDILHRYAVAALVAFPLRRLSPTVLIVLGMSFATYSIARSAGPLTNAIQDNALVAQANAARAAGRPVTAAQRAGIKSLDGWHKEVRGTRKAAAEELVQRREGYTGWRRAMIDEWLSRYKTVLGALRGFWEAAATILLGAGLFKLGILQGQRDRGFYARMAIGWYVVGLSIRLVETLVTARIDDTVTYAWSLDEVGRLATTLGHLGLIHWALLGATGRRWLAPFAAAGRTALSLYILQTLSCLWLLYPPFALGLFGRQGWAGLMATALAIDLALLWLANRWVRHFAIAPVEWAWRSLAEGRRLPFGRVDRPAAVHPLPA